MQVKELQIKRAASYEANANQLIGVVHLDSPSGSQTVRLSNQALSNIFAVITKDVIATAHANTSQVKRALEDATSEPTLLTAATITIEGE